MRSLPLLHVKTVFLLFLIFRFNPSICAEEYRLLFSAQFYSLLNSQKAIFFSSNLPRKEFFNAETLKKFLSEAVGCFSDCKLMELTFVFLETQHQVIILSEDEARNVSLVLKQYLQQMLGKNLQLLQEYNLKRIGEENFIYCLADEFHSFFQGHEEDPIAAIGDFLYEQPINRGISLSF